MKIKEKKFYDAFVELLKPLFWWGE